MATKHGSKSNEHSSSRTATHSAELMTDHDEIRKWAEERKARPAIVKGTEKGESGVIRLDFPGYSGGDSLEHISWEQFFEIFEDRKLALLHQDTTASGERSNFNKLVRRDSGEE